MRTGNKPRGDGFSAGCLQKIKADHRKRYKSVVSFLFLEIPGDSVSLPLRITDELESGGQLR